MPVDLNHTIVHARAPHASAAHLASVLVERYAFLVRETEFDQILGRLVEQGSPYWADPGHRHSGINRSDSGRGLYRNNSDGHLAIITRPPCGGAS
jgi:hypothetical protein